jgi:DNA-binding NarL/FixJ family response regulator
MIRLLVADDHAAMRHGLRQLFGMLDDVVVAAEAEDGDQALQAVLRGGLDLALLDLSMPGISGVALIERIRANDAQLPMLVLSMHSEPQIILRALAAGAQAYLVKGGEAEHLVDEVRRVAAAGVPQAASQATPSPVNSPNEPLSPFEARVAQLLTERVTPGEMARLLGIREATLKRYVAKLEQTQGNLAGRSGGAGTAMDEGS